MDFVEGYDSDGDDEDSGQCAPTSRPERATEPGDAGRWLDSDSDDDEEWESEPVVAVTAVRCPPSCSSCSTMAPVFMRAQGRSASTSTRVGEEEEGEGSEDDENMHGSFTGSGSEKGFTLGPMHKPRAVKKRKPPPEKSEGKKSKNTKTTGGRQRSQKSNTITPRMRASTDLCKANCIIADSKEPGKMRCFLCDRTMSNTKSHVDRHIDGPDHQKRLAEREENEKNATKDKAHIRQYFKKDPTLVGARVPLDTTKFRSVAHRTSATCPGASTSHHTTVMCIMRAGATL